MAYRYVSSIGTPHDVFNEVSFTSLVGLNPVYLQCKLPFFLITDEDSHLPNTGHVEWTDTPRYITPVTRLERLEGQINFSPLSRSRIKLHSMGDCTVGTSVVET